MYPKFITHVPSCIFRVTRCHVGVRCYVGDRVETEFSRVTWNMEQPRLCIRGVSLLRMSNQPTMAYMFGAATQGVVTSITVGFIYCL